MEVEMEDGARSTGGKTARFHLGLIAQRIGRSSVVLGENISFYAVFFILFT